MHTPLLAALLTTALTVPSVSYHVSPNGNDDAPGTQDQPYATLHAARDAARRIDGGSVTIYLHGGTHYLDKPLILTPLDSGAAGARIVYRSLPGETAIISGGQRLELDWKSCGSGIMRAQVPEDLTSDQLFVNGQRQRMARYPNFDPSSQYFQGYSAACTSTDRVKQWDNPTGGFLHAMHGSLWGDMHWRITGKTNDGRLEMIGGWQNNRQTAAHLEYRFVENIFEELDAAGEWYLDERAGVLYFYPPAGFDPGRAKIEAVRLPHLVVFRGTAESPVRHIVLENLTFTHTRRTFMENKEPLLRSDWTTYRDGAILFDGATDCTVRDCQVNQVGGNAIFVSKFNRGIEITGCHIADAGANAISFVGDPKALRSPLFEYHQTQTLEQMDLTAGPRTDNFPSKCLVEDCLIYRNGRVEKQTAGVNICMAQSITIRHCSIYDCPRAGINICDGSFGGHLIEFNDVFATVKETDDHGSFNSWGRDRFWHPDRSQTADWLKTHPDMPKWDCPKRIIIRNNRWRCDHGWDIDLDDGSSNYEIYNNLCLAGGIKLREGYFRQVSNNILVDYTFCPHVWYPNCHSTFKRNIIWRDGYASSGIEQIDHGADIDFNLVHQAGTEPRPAENLAKFGGDRHSIIADARFVDPGSGNYRVQDGSPALALGWKNFAMDRFGVRKPELKKLAKTPPLPGTLAAAAIRSGGWGRPHGRPQTAQWLGAKVKNIEDQGEMSAVGLGDQGGVLIVSVSAQSIAASLGLKQNDVIRAVNGQEIEHLRGLASAAKRSRHKERIAFGLWRDQAEFELLATWPLPTQ
jgi:PDZ domain-containing protein